MTAPLPAHLLEGLADTLWQQRHTVESLLYRMVVAKLLLAADEHRFVAAAIDEVEDVVDALHRTEQHRLDALVSVADRLQIPVEDLSLAEIARQAPTPMQPVFTDHREAFLALTTEVEQTAEANRRLASSALARLQRSLDALAGSDPSASSDEAGRPDRAVAARSRHLDGAL